MVSALVPASVSLNDGLWLGNINKPFPRLLLVMVFNPENNLGQYLSC